jgi:transcriptional regulator with XRE-family HTH domain
MARNSRGARGSRAEHGRSRKLDLDRLLDGRPQAKTAAEWAEVTAAAGELVRRKRVESGISQSELATRIGSTQAHISELERGLGPNGPTVAMLTRIIHEFGDDLVVDTKNERSRREAEQMVSARSSVGDLAAQLGADLQREGFAVMLREWSDLAKAAADNPFAKMLSEGMLAGLYMALQWLPGHSRREIRSALESIENPSAKGRGELPAQLISRLHRG